MSRFVGVTSKVVCAFCAFSAGVVITYLYNRCSGNTKNYNPILSVRHSYTLEKLKIKQIKPLEVDQLDELIKYGIPSDENLLIRLGYIISYSNRLKQPNWVLEMLTKDRLESIEDETDRIKCIFMADPEIHPMFSSKNEDFKSSGYQRGHLAAACNHKISQERICMTFLLSNICPQIGKGFNQNIWLNLENHTRQLVNVYDRIYIVTGPLFLSMPHEDGYNYVKYRVIGTNQIAVPTHFFKVILGVNNNGSYEIQSYVIPNAALSDDAKFYDYSCPIQNIEKAAGLLFFDKIPREDILQTKISKVTSTTTRRRKLSKSSSSQRKTTNPKGQNHNKTI